MLELTVYFNIRKIGKWQRFSKTFELSVMKKGHHSKLHHMKQMELSAIVEKV